MAYKYKNDMSNQYNEFTPEDFNNMNYGGQNSYMPPTGMDPNMNISPIGMETNTMGDWGGGNLPQAGVVNPPVLGAQQPANWNIMGDTLQDGFQLNDMKQWGQNLFGAAKSTYNNSPTVQAGQDLWGGLDNKGKFGTVFSGLETLGGLYKGFKGMQMAKDQANQQTDMWNKSWDANKKQFNESVASRAQGKFNGYGDQKKRDDYSKKYSV